MIIISRRILVNKYQVVITSIPVTERGRSKESNNLKLFEMEQEYMLYHVGIHKLLTC